MWVQSLDIFPAVDFKDIEKPSITATAKTVILQEAKSMERQVWEYESFAYSDPVLGLDQTVL